MRKTLIFVMLFLCINNLALAATPTWHGSTIKSIYPLADGRVIIKFNAGHQDCSGNIQNQPFYLSVNENSVTQEALKNMLSVALTAATTKKTVTINFDADSSGCQINRMSVEF